MNLSFIAPSPSDTFYFGDRRHELENLLDIDLDRTVLKARVAEHNAQRLQFGQFLHEGFVNAATGVEAGGKHIAIDKEHVFTLDGLLGDRQGQIDAPIQHYLEQQILRRAIRLDVVNKQVEIGFLQHIGAVVDVSHVRCIDFKQAKS